MPIPSLKQRRKIFNVICVLIGLISVTFGLFVARLLGIDHMFYFESIITLAFFTIPLLPKVIDLNYRLSLAFMILDFALIYWGILLGPLSFIPIVVPFLAGITGLLIRNRTAKFISWTFIGSTLIFLELNYFLDWFAPLRIEHKHQLIIREVVIIAGSSLSLTILYYYRKEWINEKIAKLLNKLTEANEAKSIYLRETSHELRNPLASIHIVAEKMYQRRDELKNLPGGTGLVQEVEALYRSSFVARDIVNNILDLSKIESGQRSESIHTTINLHSEIQSIINIQRFYAESKNVRIVVSYDNHLPATILTDRISLIKIINNLISNAIKFAPQGSAVQISISKSAQSLCMSVLNEGTVSDFQLNNIFVPFIASRNTDVSEGTGLGLPITAHLVESLKGKITFDRLTDKIQVRFSIPITEGTHIQDNSTGVKVRMLNGFQILCVEDDSIFSSLLKMLISDTGAIPLMASNGNQAFEILQQNIPDLIITDRNMPGMDGSKFIKRLKDDISFQHIPVIMISGDAFSDEKERALSDGASAYLIKPFLKDEFHQLLCEHLPFLKVIMIN